MTTLEILRAARALIAQPGRWCQGDYARTAEGDCAHPGFPGAYAFCSVGAVRQQYDEESDWTIEAVEQLRRTAQDMGHSTVFDLNDTTDLPTVLAMFDATIARLEGQG